MLSDGPLGQLLMPTSMEGQAFYGGEGEEGVASFKLFGCLCIAARVQGFLCGFGVHQITAHRGFPLHVSVLPEGHIVLTLDCVYEPSIW
jgi:hypothetical protein